MPTISHGPPPDPHLRRWMMFVDGENFTIRGQNFAEGNGVHLADGPWHKRDVFLWLPGVPATTLLTKGGQVELLPRAVRAFYYTSVVGDDPKLRDVKDRLWNLGFSPRVFKKDRGAARAKAVDIALARDLLSNAFLANFDAAVLVAGDGDYVPIVEEVQRLGKVVYLLSLSGGLSEELRLASDASFVMDDLLAKKWRDSREGEIAPPGVDLRLVRFINAST